MIRWLPVSAVLLVASTTLAAQRPSPPKVPIPVYVTSVGAVDGMTDPSKDNLDTVRDLKNSLSDHRREVRLVDKGDEASIVLTVQNRDTEGVTASAFGSGRDRTIRVAFKAGGIDTMLTASAMGGTLSSGGAWKKAAGKVADQVRDWIRANHDKLPAKAGGGTWPNDGVR
jgi:hypothetical protein